MSVLINLVAYQIAWLACVLGAANRLPWLGTSVSLAFVTTHVVTSSNRAPEIKLLVAAVLIGLVVDSALFTMRIVEFNAGVWIQGVAPHWMLALWLAFAATLNVSMRWLTTRPFLAVLFGAFGGPLAYYAGMRLGAMTIPRLDLGLAAIGSVWAAAMWLLTVIATRLNGAIALKARAA